MSTVPIPAPAVGLWQLCGQFILFSGFVDQRPLQTLPNNSSLQDRVCSAMHGCMWSGSSSYIIIIIIISAPFLPSWYLWSMLHLYVPSTRLGYLFLYALPISRQPAHTFTATSPFYTLHSCQTIAHCFNERQIIKSLFGGRNTRRWVIATIPANQTQENCIGFRVGRISTYVDT